MPREVVHQHLPEFVAGIDEFRETEDLSYDLIHAHYWLSGVAALELRERWGAPGSGGLAGRGLDGFSGSTGGGSLFLCHG